MSHLASLYRPGFGLLTDLYQLTMAAGYHDRGVHEKQAVFHLFYRTPPFGGSFALAGGLPLAADLIENFRFGAEDVQYLGRLRGPAGQPLFGEPFLNYLQRLRFTGTVHALPEGAAVFPHEPILRVEAPLLQAQLLETALLTLVNFSTLITTKAARIKAAAGSDTVLEFGLRRAQGIDGGLTASRAAYVGGCDATSNVWAGRYYGIPVRGTHAHSWVMAFDSEDEAFAAYAAAQPHNAVFLVDTYDTLAGVEKAVAIGKTLREQGHELLGVRLDSGDLAALSRAARRILNEGGFPEAKIVASDSLDEYAIADLKARGARIDVWGIGTRLATAYDQPALGGVYKLAAIRNEAGTWEQKVKRSDTAAKTSNPGRLNVRNLLEGGRPVGRVLYNELDGSPPVDLVDAQGRVRTRPGLTTGPDLLQPLIEQGRPTPAFPSLPDTRARALNNWSAWTDHAAKADFQTLYDARLHVRKLAILAEK